MRDTITSLIENALRPAIAASVHAICQRAHVILRVAAMMLGLLFTVGANAQITGITFNGATNSTTASQLANSLVSTMTSTWDSGNAPSVLTSQPNFGWSSVTVTAVAGGTQTVNVEANAVAITNDPTINLTCTIPAGGTSCTTSSGAFSGTVPWAVYVQAKNTSAGTQSWSQTVLFLSNSSIAFHDFYQSAQNTYLFDVDTSTALTSISVKATNASTGVSTNFPGTITAPGGTTGWLGTGQVVISALPGGTYNFVATATNSSGGSITTSWSGSVVTTPSVTFSAANGAIVSSLASILTTVADASDPSPTISSATLTGGPSNSTTSLTMTGTGTSGQFMIASPPTLSSGSYTLSVTAKNASGGTTTQTLTFTYDASPPTVAFSAASGSMITSLSNILTTVVDSADSSPKVSAATLTGGPSNISTALTTAATGTAGQFKITSTPTLGTGQYTLTITAVDKGGLTTTQAINFTYDGSPPAVTFSNPNGSVVTSLNSLLTTVVDAADSTPIITSATLSGGPSNTSTSLSLSATGTPGQFSIKSAPTLASGQYTLTVNAKDSGGLTGSGTLTFTYDSGPPTLTFSVNNGSLVTSMASVLITVVDAADSTPQIQSLNLAGGPSNINAPLTAVAAGSAGQFSVGSLPTIAAGQYTLTATAIDTAGLTTTKALTFTYDSTPPTLSFSVASGAYVPTVGSIVLSVTDPADPSPRIQSATLTGGPSNITASLTAVASSTPGQFTLASAPSLVVGQTYTLSATAVNKYGLTATQNVSFIYEPIPPTLTFSIANGASIGSLGSVIMSVSDPIDSAPKIQSISVTGGPSNSATQISAVTASGTNQYVPASYPVLLLGQTYTLSATVASKDGLTTTQSVTFTFNPAPPVVTFSSKNNGTVSSLTGLTVTVTDGADPSPTLSAVTLTGGPTNLSATLTAVPTGTPGQFTLSSYPLMFPTNGPGQVYALTATGVSADGLSTTTSTTFTYTPQSANVMGWSANTARIPAIPQIPTTLKTQPMFVSGNTSLSGQVAVLASLRADSTIPITINGVTVAPGQTQTVASAYDFTSNVSILSLPVNAATAGAVGSAYLMLTIATPGAPVVVAEVDTWAPAQDIVLGAVSGSPTSYVDDVQQFSAQAKSGWQADCAGSLFYVLSDTVTTVAKSLQPGAWACAVQADAAAGDATDVTADSLGVHGYLHAVGANAVAYEPGVIYRDPSTSQLAFYSGGRESLALQGTAVQNSPPATSFLVATAPNAVGSTMAHPITMLGQAQYAGKFQAVAPVTGLSMNVTDPTGKVTPLSTISNTLSDMVNTNTSKISDTQDFQFDVFYTRRPDVVWHTDMNFEVATPNVQVNINRPAPFMSTTDSSLTGQVGILQGGAFAFNPDTMGDWRIQAYLKTATRGANGIVTATQLNPLGAAPVPVNADGTFSVDLGMLPAGTADVVVKATLFKNGAATTRVVTTLDQQYVVTDGSAISTTLVVAQAASGAITPTQAFTPVLNVVMDSKRLTDTSGFNWQVSTDNGATWTSAGTTTAPGLRPAITKSGTYLYKVDVVNRYSTTVSESNTVTVEGFLRPTLTIQGPTAGYATSPVTWTAASTVPDTAFTWTVKTAANDPNPQTFTGSTLEYTPTGPGTLWITLAGREDTGTLTNTLRTTSVQLLFTVAPLGLPKPIISGGHVLETGKQATFTVTQNLPYNKNLKSDQTIVGQWLLPDGTTQPGFDPAVVTIQSGQTTIGYESWVDGMQSTTDTKTSFLFSTWTYQFPSMTITQSMPDNRAPAYGVYIANYANPADARNTGGEKFTFGWSLPPGASITTQNGSTIGVTFTQPGTQELDVTVSDTRGNSQTVSKSITIAPAPQLAATLSLQGSDHWSRAPSNVLARLVVASLPKNDTISQVVYSLDGTPVLTTTNPSTQATIPVATAGDHTITAAITTAGGASATASQSFSLVTGDNPVCNITESGNAAQIILREACTVQEGKIVGLSWSVNGQPTSLSSAFITFTGAQLATLQSATVTATTDKGQTGQASWSH